MSTESNLLYYIEHKVKTEKWWTVYGAVGDYLTVDNNAEAYLILDAIESGDMVAIGELVKRKLLAAYGEDADDYVRERDRVVSEQISKEVAEGV